MRYLLVVATLLAGCGVVRINEVDPNPQLARDMHKNYLLSGQGFGVDPSAPAFYESFEGFSSSSTRWQLLNAGSAGDTWKSDATQANFGSRSLTYGGNDVIVQNIDFGKATLTSREAVALSATKPSVMILFARFLVTGAEDDKAALRVEVSPDLGFSWKVLTPEEPATDSIDAPATKPGQGSIWGRFRFDLAEFQGLPVRVRLGVSATANSRKLLYIDDLLVAEK